MPVYILPPLLTDKLSAINAMLGAIGSSPVSSIEVSEDVDVANALVELDGTARDVLSEGWHWNREYGLTLTPDTDGEIQLPANCLSVMSAYYTPALGSSDRIAERGRRLYNHSTHSFQFVAPVVVDMKLALEWEEMTEPARRYITIRACQLFQGRHQGSSIVYQVQQEEVVRARVNLDREEAEANPQNQITGNVQTAQRLHGRGVRRGS